MLRRIVIGTYSGNEVAFDARTLEKFFSIEKPYKLPGVSANIAWIQSLRGKCVTLFAWWQILEAEGICGFLSSGNETAVQDAKDALLFSIDGAHVGFPLSEVTTIREIDDSNIGGVGSIGSHIGVIGSYQGMLVLNPAALFSISIDKAGSAA
jgi:hypothetical protein